jgi:hypothetical protein
MEAVRSMHALSMNDLHEEVMHDANPVSSIKACKPRAVLTEGQAIEIFHVKLMNDRASSQTCRTSAAELAKKYRIGEKTVRDIWKGRTWFRELMHLDPSRATMVDRLKLPGRPKGSKDKRQRVSINSSSASTQEKSPTWRLAPSCLPPPSYFASGDKADSSPHQHAAGPIPHALCCSDDTTFATRSVLADDDQPRMMCSEASWSTQAPSPTSPIPSPTPSDCACRAAAAAAAAELPPALPESSQAEDPFHDDWLYWPGAP